MILRQLNDAITERRRLTRNSIFHYLYYSEQPRSKQDIANDLDLSLPTVYQNISELMDAGLVDYVGPARSSGGRPAMQLQVVSNARYAIGIGIAGHHLCFAATDLSREQIAYKDLPHRHDVESPGYAEFVAMELENFISEQRIARARILGIGISVAGIILPEDSTIFHAPTLYVRNLSLRALIDAIPYPTIAENDANGGGFAEWFGQDRQKNLAFLSLTEGVGGSLLVNGDQYIGDHYRSGEFGHMCVEWNGLPCACGKRGCLEAYCGVQRLSDDLGITLDEFFRDLEAGNPEYKQLWEDFKKHLAIGVHNIRMALDCDIYLGGVLSDYLEPYLPELKAMLSEIDAFDRDCDYLRLSRYTGDSSMLGVALRFIRDFLESI